MPDLSFEVLAASPAADMVTPAMTFQMRVANAFPDQQIDAVLLRFQLRIEVARRRYTPQEQAQLASLFDRPERWNETLRPITWITTAMNLPGFRGAMPFTLTAPCPSDFTAATPQYFHGLEAGEVPLAFLFSGTVFHTPQGHTMQAAPISWDKEARFRLPVATWKQAMDLYYPDAAFLHLRRDVFDGLYQYKVRAGITTFDEAIERMLAIAERERLAS